MGEDFLRHLPDPPIVHSEPATEPLLNRVCDAVAWHDGGYWLVERGRDMPGESGGTEGRAADPGDRSGSEGLAVRFDGIWLLNSWGNPSQTLIPTHHSTNTSIPLSMSVSVLTRLAIMREAPRPPAITYPLIEKLGKTTTRQRKRVARQWEGEGTEALVARIHVDEGAYAGALEAAD